MTEAARSAEEIEDVLASIRRLVAGPAAKQGGAPAAAGDDKLVLTPALRVNDPDDPWAPIPRQADEDAPEGADAENPAQSSWGLEDRLADWGEIADSAAEAVSDAIAEGLETDSAAHRPDAGPVRAPLTHLQSAIGGIEFEAETGDTDWPDANADRALRSLVQRRGQAPDEGAPAADDPALQGAMDAPAAADGPPPPRGPDHQADAGAQHAAGGDDDARTDDMPDDRSLHMRADDDDGHGVGDDADEDTDDDGDVLIDDAADGVEDLGETASPFSFPDSEDSILDEETLREIVAEVVRQELQGALGQRITRNVRKMVRREIRLALAAAALE